MKSLPGRWSLSVLVGVGAALLILAAWSLFTRERRVAVEASAVGGTATIPLSTVPMTIPLIDRVQPVDIETATFAMG